MVIGTSDDTTDPTIRWPARPLHLLIIRTTLIPCILRAAPLIGSADNINGERRRKWKVTSASPKFLEALAGRSARLCSRARGSDRTVSKLTRNKKKLLITGLSRSI